MGEKFLNLSGLSLYDRNIKEWTQEKIAEAIKNISLSKVAKSGSYHDLQDKTHDAKIDTRVLEDTSIQFAYRSDEFNKVNDTYCRPFYYDDNSVSCQIVSDYYYNVTFDGVLYENLLANKIVFTDPVLSYLKYVGIGNPSLFTNPVLREVTEEELSIPFYLVAVDGADPEDTSNLGTVWLFTKEKGTYTFTVQCTGEKKYNVKPLISMGMYAGGVTTMEEFMEIMSGETVLDPPVFDPNETYTFTLDNNTYNLRPKFLNSPLEMEGDAGLVYFGSESLIEAAVSAFGESIPITFDQYEEGDFAALLLTIPGQGTLFITATSLPLELDPNINAYGPCTFNFIAPGYYVDMQILQMQIPGVDPFTQTFYAEAGSSDTVSPPVLSEQEVTLETLDIDRDPYAIGYSENVPGEDILGISFSNLNNGSYGGDYYINDKRFDSSYYWKNNNTIFWGNAFFLDDFSDVYDLSSYDETQQNYIKNCPFLIKLEQVADYSSSNRLYNVTFYTKYQGNYEIRRANSKAFKFVSRYSVSTYNTVTDNVLNREIYFASPKKVLENNIFVVDWHKCLSDDLRLTKGQKLSVLLGEETYEVEVKEDEVTGLVYAGNPEFLPILYYVPNLDYSKKEADVPFIICTINHAINQSSSNVWSLLRGTTRIYFNPDIISNPVRFKVSYDTLNVTEPFKPEIIESSLPSFDWNVNEYSSNSHIMNRTHFDSRKGHACLPQVGHFYKSLYDSSQGGYYVSCPNFDQTYGCELSFIIKYNNSAVVEKNYEISFDIDPYSISEKDFAFKNDDFSISFTSRDNDESGSKIIYLRFYVDYSLLTDEMKQDLQNVTIDLTLSTKSESLTISGLEYQISSNDNAQGSCYPVHKMGRTYTVDGQTEYINVSNYRIKESYIKSLPFVMDGIYTVVLNGKNYQFKIDNGWATDYSRSKYYVILGSYNYALCGAYNSYNSYYLWDKSYEHTKYDYAKFGISLSYELCPNNTVKFVSGTVTVDSNELSDSFEYPNFTGLDIYYGELKELDSKYIPKAEEITDGSDGFTTGGQVYDYIEELSISDTFINSLFDDEEEVLEP